MSKPSQIAYNVFILTERLRFFLIDVSVVCGTPLFSDNSYLDIFRSIRREYESEPEEHKFYSLHKFLPLILLYKYYTLKRRSFNTKIKNVNNSAVSYKIKAPAAQIFFCAAGALLTYPHFIHNFVYRFC